MLHRIPVVARLVAAYVGAIRLMAGLTMGAIVAIMIAQVFARYVMGASLIWAEELCRYLLIWQTFLVLGLAYSNGEFVHLDFATRLLSDRGRWILKAVMAIPVVVFLVLIAQHGAAYAARFQNQTIPAMDFIWESIFAHPAGISIRWVYISVSVGSALMAVHVIADLVGGFGGAWRTARQDGLPDDGHDEAGGAQG